MTTTTPPFTFVRHGTSFAGTPQWNVFTAVTHEYLGYVANATSKRNGTIWMAKSPGPGRSVGGWRNREAAAEHLLKMWKEG